MHLMESMHLTEFTANPTTTDCTRVFPKVTTESYSLRQGSSSFRCLPSSQVNTPHNPKKIANKRFMVDLC